MQSQTHGFDSPTGSARRMVPVRNVREAMAAFWQYDEPRRHRVSLEAAPAAHNALVALSEIYSPPKRWSQPGW